ncbi:hypothetical protein [Sulfoacidibacillus thermotolerans]|uniref:Uncharacterized protein n=1 Tax=Sulfoacidibacillus thermotolerans TaxID=1765684 RepID=A0A2U3D457_SULT2|nr:hypothetical protein [Sulfoacidibacillus thermotolerans]PWI56055.1 hypothetical protein BM613_13200 [Sulfoacidibacillus thermotolerans]
MTNSITAFDQNYLQRLGINEAEAKAIVEAGFTLEEYEATLATAQELESNAELVPVRYKIIAQAGAFMNEATGEVIPKLKVQIPFFHTSRVLFPKQEQDNQEGTMPLCSSVDGKAGQYVDENGVIMPRSCQGCPFDVYGSDFNGGRGKACKTMRRLYVLTADSDVPAVLNLPPSSLKVWDQFVSAVRFQGQFVSSFEIELALEIKRNGANTWSQLKQPTVVRALTPVERMRVLKIGKELEEKHKSYKVSVDDYTAIELPPVPEIPQEDTKAVNS